MFVSSTKNLAWSDEQTRLYLQLRIEEKLKRNIRKQIVNDAGRQSIIDKFYEVFGKRHPWKKFGIKFTTCKKQYESFKRLTHNRNGLGYDATGLIKMFEDWWNERCKEWSGARKVKEKPVANMDLMETVFGTVYISGGEGWTAQQGEEHLDTMHMDHDDHDDAESRRNILLLKKLMLKLMLQLNQEMLAPHLPVGQRLIKKRSRALQAGQVVADVIRDSIESRDKIISHKNQLIESHPEFSCSQLRAMKVLHSLPAIRIWSPLYKAAINHLKQDPANRQTFLFYEKDENKVIYLEFATGESRDA